MALKDEMIREKILNVLRREARFGVGAVTPFVENGVVTLTGAVDTHWKRPYLEELVRDVRGVVVVHDNITVVPTRSATDELIAEDVIAALNKNPLVNADSIEVRVENAIVTLVGRVCSPQEKDAAVEEASRIPGVTAVKDKLVVGQAAA